MYVSHWNSWAIRRHAGVRFVRGLVALALLGAAPSVRAQGPSTSTRTYDRSRDRGEGLPTSIFGTYVRGREFLVSPFYEHYRDRNYEYTPEELGFLDSLDYRGRYRANEGLLFLAYGITDDLAVEFEASGISASLGKAATDRSGLPPQTKESGLGDVEGQLRWRWHRETDSRPEAFSYVEYVIPHNRDKPLIGTAGWQWKFGTGVVRGYRWGTLTARAAVEYDAASSSQFDLGEYAIEYLRRLSPAWRLYVGVEGTQDELELIGEVQWHVASNVFFRFNSGFGLTSRATDWAPDVGVVFSFGPR